MQRRSWLLRRAADDAAVDEAGVEPGHLLRAHRRDRIRVDVDAVESVRQARDLESRMRRTDREDDVRLAAHGDNGSCVAKGPRTGARCLAATLGRPDDVVAVSLQDGPDRGTHLAGMQQADDHSTSTSTNAKNATEMTPFIVKNAASSRRRSPGRTSVCS